MQLRCQNSGSTLKLYSCYRAAFTIWAVLRAEGNWYEPRLEFCPFQKPGATFAQGGMRRNVLGENIVIWGKNISLTPSQSIGGCCYHTHFADQETELPDDKCLAQAHKGSSAVELGLKLSAGCFQSPCFLQPPLPPRSPALLQSSAGSEPLLITSRTESRSKGHLRVLPLVLKIKMAQEVVSLADSWLCPCHLIT